MFGMLLMYFFVALSFHCPNLNLLRFFFFLEFSIKKSSEKKPRGKSISNKGRREFLWKFKRNISFYFDSAILLSVKQIIIQKLGVKNTNEKKKTRKTLKVWGKWKEKFPFKNFNLSAQVFFCFLCRHYIESQFQKVEKFKNGEFEIHL